MRSDIGSVKHVLSEGSKAFFVALVDAFVLTDGEGTTGDSLHLSDAQELYRGVFWKVGTTLISGRATGVEYDTRRQKRECSPDLVDAADTSSFGGIPP